MIAWHIQLHRIFSYAVSEVRLARDELEGVNGWSPTHDGPPRLGDYMEQIIRRLERLETFFGDLIRIVL